MPSDSTIFVLLASYRDPECQWTVNDLFDKAAHPERIFVGICLQADPKKDRNCLVKPPFTKQLRELRFDPAESRGLGWARAHAQKLWDGEDYALQIDSHMRFVSDWDERMLANLAACDSANPVLTVYPPAYTPPNQLDLTAEPRVQCTGEFTDSGILLCAARPLPAGVEATGPLPTACLAGGFVFGASAWLQSVPHDPEIYFNGEEIALAARLWTHGFDLFSPTETLLFHYYKRVESPRPWSDDSGWHEKHRMSLTRLAQLLTPDRVSPREQIDLGVYGLGTERSLAEYEAYAGISFSGRSIAPFARTFPFVRTDDIARTLRADHEIRPSSQAHLFIVDGEGLLFSAVRGEIYHLNTAATFVWCAMEDGAGWPEVVTRLSSLCGLDATAAEDILTNLIAHWRGQGVLQGNEQDAGKGAFAPPRADGPEAVDNDASYAFDRFVCYREQHYQLLNSRFVIQFGGSEQAETLMPSLRHLETAATNAVDHRITVAQDGDRYLLFCDGRPVYNVKALSQLAPYLKHQAARLALNDHDHILTLHAGAVAKDGSLIVLPANSGEGKSTLVAGLVRAGFRYFSDEIAPLSQGSCKVTPVPLGICVKESAFPVLLGRYPEIAQLRVHDREDGRRAVYLPPPRETIAQVADAIPATHLVFHRYQAGADTELSPISRSQALGRALAQCVSIPAPLTLDDAAALVNWIEQVECYEMISGSLDASVAQMEQLVERRSNELKVGVSHGDSA